MGLWICAPLVCGGYVSQNPYSCRVALQTNRQRQARMSVRDGTNISLTLTTFYRVVTKLALGTLSLLRRSPPIGTLCRA